MRQPIRGGIRLKGLKASGRFKSGNTRYYYRATGTPLPDAPKDSPDFLAAYAAAAKGEPLKSPKATHKAGTIGAAVRGYLASDVFLSLANTTKAQRRRIVEQIEDKYGTGNLTDLQAKHIRLDLAPMKPNPATHRLKAWRGLCRWAVDAGLIDTDPARDVRKPAAPKTDGHTPWEESDIATFRAFWAIGTPQRLALELMAHTGAAIGDATRLGRNNIKGGWITYKRHKSKTVCAIPLTESAPHWFPASPFLHECIEPVPRALTFLATTTGRPRSEKSAAQWFSAAARKAGIYGKTAHGVRKYLATAMAERGATPEQRMAILGHESSSQTREYSKTADAKRIIMGTDFDNSEAQVVKMEKKPNKNKGVF